MSYILADTYLRIGLPDQARFHLLDTLDWHLTVGKVWQTLGSLWSMAVGYTQLLGDEEFAVGLLSLVYHHPDAVPGYKQGIEEFLPEFKGKMGMSTFAAAWESGKEWDFDVAIAQVRLALTGALPGRGYLTVHQER